MKVPRLVPPVVAFPHADKLVHAVMYGVLTVLSLWGAVLPPARSGERHVWFTAAAAT